MLQLKNVHRRHSQPSRAREADDIESSRQTFVARGRKARFLLLLMDWDLLDRPAGRPGGLVACGLRRVNLEI
jgi:hypothetical protein